MPCRARYALSQRLQLSVHVPFVAPDAHANRKFVAQKTGPPDGLSFWMMGLNVTCGEPKWVSTDRAQTTPVTPGTRFVRTEPGLSDTISSTFVILGTVAYTARVFVLPVLSPSQNWAVSGREMDGEP